MFLLLTIFQYFIQAGVDVADKFLITKRKIEPLQYTFYTVVTGAALLVIWPFVFEHIPGRAIALNIFSGIWFSVAFYIFYRALAQGEVSRVVTFVFGIIPVFDIIYQWIFHGGSLTIQEFSALALLIPGALLISYHPGKFWRKHVLLKVSAAGLLSAYNFFWQYGTKDLPVLNSLMWNRLGAAGILLLLLLIPLARRHILKATKGPKAKKTSALFLIKQAVGGGNFILLSYLYAVGSIPVISSLQGFRYVFLFLGGLVLSHKYKHIIEEDVNKHTLHQKVFAIVLIGIGTIILFI